MSTAASTTGFLRWRRWPLQRRLIAAITAIVALIMIAVAIATSVFLGRVLYGQLDDEVRAAGQLARNPTIQTAAQNGTSATELLNSINGLQPGSTFLLAIEANGVRTGAVSEHGNVATLSSSQLDAIGDALSTQGPTTVSLGSLSSFRVQAFPAGNAILVVGYGDEDVTATIGRMLLTVGSLTIAGLIALVLATTVIVRSGLRPLRAVAATATRVAALPLGAGTVSIDERVPSSEADPATEVGQVGEALNTLLDHVGASLAERQRNEERMRQFVADASHELRTPLASIRGYSELSLRDRTLTDTTEQSLERIQAQSVRMTRIVEDLLLLARLDEGQELVFGTVDLTRLMREAVGDAAAAGPEHVFAFDDGSATGDDAEPVRIAGDASRLAQVAANLLANARTHTPAGTSVTGSVVREGTDAVLRVHDDGPGIDPRIAHELFERFARADLSRARQSGGSGLGLSIARAIVTAHGGEISVDSRPGDTTFTVRLPARPHDPAPAA